MTGVVCAVAVLTACRDGEDPPVGEDIAASAAALCATRAVALDLTQPTLPLPPDFNNDPLQSSGRFSTNELCAWDFFAWNTFAALNWPASGNRGYPNLAVGPDSSYSTSFSSAGSADVVVWETFKEKREIFHEDGTAPDTSWFAYDDFPVPVNIVDTNNGFCSMEDEAAAPTVNRHLNSGGKLLNSLDETAEVASEALEAAAMLCGGYTGTERTYCTDSVPNTKVGPRVWKGTPADSVPVYYEVKVNYDFFEYVVKTQHYGGRFYNDSVAMTGALLGGIQLPFREAGDAFGGANVDAVKNYTTAGCLSNYMENDTISSPEAPCGIGAVHIKAAWIPMETADTTYHTTTATYFESRDDDKVCKATSTFGLIGLHIIQRVHIPEQTSAPRIRLQDGGAFVFATWEHTSVLGANPATPNYTYVNYSNVDPSTGMLSTSLYPYPKLDSALAVTRKHALLAQTTTATQMVWDSLPPNSVWRNYQLIGTQFAATDSALSASLAQPHFLANAVIETNDGLQTFEGIPPYQPATQPPQYANTTDTANSIIATARKVVPNDTRDFDRSHDNITFGGQARNMGGCMGCHGVAQQNGYSFSFVLLGGQRGAKTDTELDFVIPPPARVTTLPLYLTSQVTGGPVITGDALSSPATLSQKGSAHQQWRLGPADDGGAPALTPPPGYFVIENDVGMLGINQGAVAGDSVFVQGGGIGGTPDTQLWRPIQVSAQGVTGVAFANKMFPDLILTNYSGLLIVRAAVSASADPATIAQQLWSLGVS